MDKKQEEMQFLGLFGICKESYNIIFKWRKIFSQITLALILPTAFVFIANMKVSNALFAKITDAIQVSWMQSVAGTPDQIELSLPNSISWTQLLFFKALYITFLLFFSSLSTAAVVYTIACIYTGQDVGFKMVMRVVPKVWKRLVITSTCALAAIFASTIATLLTIAVIRIMISRYIPAIVFVLLVLFFMGFVYITLVWQTANVVSVLEEAYGIKAMIKSKALVKGKTKVTGTIILMMTISFVIMKTAFSRLVDGSSLGMVNRVSYGIVCFLLLVLLILFELVIQTVAYFVCKSYHHENIDKSTILDHLDAGYHGYAPLKAEDAQPEK
ncbi:unnamed protein product [Dovyalis caffra]|uniref:Uncharacterized protein n=1 Tax=Dovyalis caffra TaxID=77055 RepID=A0AAV1S9U5_9ROSI|nr:unnamed protein product [Dovyalis caffra]